MRKSVTLGIVAASFALFPLALQAAAIDTAGHVCQKKISGGGSINYDDNGIRNDSTVSSATVVCPITLPEATSRTLYIGGSDNNSSTNYSCYASALDINYANVSMPSITINGGTYLMGVIGAVAIPNNVVKLSVTCVIPAASSLVSGIGDLYVSY